MEVPTALFWGDKDYLGDPTDVKRTIIPSVQNMIASCELKDFNHLDFIWGMRAPSEVYMKILKHIEDNTPLC